MTPYQVNVAAEAFAAVALSQAGYDVAMQYGTTQPDWDILATKGLRTLKVQVKGSQDGGWGLFQNYKKGTDYHGALRAWESEQLADIVYFLIQFKNVDIGGAPRCYIARPKEIVAHMTTARGGHGYTSLRENHSYSRGVGAGHVDIVPASWALTLTRLDAV
ncbi:MULTISPECIES: hypothetical protein [Lysobacter]|jgi:hypothetical protein|uniref:hypothetical protein n=1 Tax=Lysobacter TaxID=68 RepID=UPI001F210C9C|nr:MULTISPECIES: hypothetical protein [Lysobacter]UJB19192.1 hypothetical protein L1A79_23250 [Lysobacter capsici]UJQ27083.1 hypothetical protein L2D09_16635 [Lysobacter gummosus]